MLTFDYSRLDSKQDTIVFWVDASFKIGGGHLGRCLALSAYANKHNVQTIFITTEKQTLEQIGVGQNCILMLKSYKGVCKALKKLKMSFNIRCLVSDINYFTDLDGRREYLQFLRLVKDSGIYLVSIEVPETDVYASDCVVIPYLGAEAISYESFSEGQFLLGSNYFFLKEEFMVVEKKLKIAASVDSIMISMGSSDPEGITLKILDAMVYIDEDIHLDVVLGGMNQLNIHKVESHLKNYKGSWKIHKNITHIAMIMNNGDLALCNNGLTRYELASLGVPTIFVSNNQKDVQFSEVFASFGSACHLGWHADLSIEASSAQINSLIHDLKRRQEMSEKGMQLVDGNGVARVFSKMMSLQIPSDR
jgi:spore coat polysaccharide biosynthesis predicted glycosyltransferase SpsG